MSNNKQSIKIYTEEQVRDAINVARFYTEQFMPNDTIVDMLKPIELPSDEEIKKATPFFYTEWGDGFFEGATYVRDLIQGGNNE